MSLLSAYDAYIPMIPSPLNPYAPSRRRRFNYYRGRIPMSPSEKLLRRKGAEAWRSETLYRQVTQYEYQAEAVIIAKTTEPQMLHPPKTQDTPTRPGSAQLECSQLTAADEPAGELSVPADRDRPKRYLLFRLPDLSLLALTRLVKAIGFWRVFSPRRMQDLLRGSRTSVM